MSACAGGGACGVGRGEGVGRRRDPLYMYGSQVIYRVSKTWCEKHPCPYTKLTRLPLIIPPHLALQAWAYGGCKFTLFENQTVYKYTAIQVSTARNYIPLYRANRRMVLLSMHGSSTTSKWPFETCIWTVLFIFQRFMQHEPRPWR